MEYESFYNFEHEPFSNVPDPKFFYSGPEHAKPFLRIMYAVQRMKGLVLLTGKVGTGKTTLSRKILASLLKEDEYVPGILVLTKDEYPPYWLTSKVAGLLNIDNVEVDANAVQLIAKKLFKLKEEGKKPVIIVDEANKLKKDENLEELRSILNIEDEQRRLITFILCGMPELRAIVNKNESLKQRVAYLVSLKELSEDSAREYIRHRLRIAGAAQEVFTSEALDEIYRISRGRPRLINTICDNALLEGVLLQKKPITREIINIATESLGLELQK